MVVAVLSLVLGRVVTLDRLIYASSFFSLSNDHHMPSGKECRMSLPTSGGQDHIPSGHCQQSNIEKVKLRLCTVMFRCDTCLRYFLGNIHNF